jgi:predicted transcriptional regulator
MAKGRTFTERELDIMNILWGEGSGTVAEVRDELPRPLGYTGVLKMLQILEEKGMVRHE